MFRKAAFVLVTLLFLSQPSFIQLVEGKEQVELSTRNVIVIYSTDHEQDIQQLHILDSLLGHFVHGQNIQFIEDNDFASLPATKEYTHLFYMGMVEKSLPESLVRYVEEFKGPTFLIGQNVEQFSRKYSFVMVKGEALMNTASLPSKEISVRLAEDRLMKHIQISQSAQGVIYGSLLEESYPLLVQEEQNYYLGTESLYNPVGYLVGEVLFSFFNETEEKNHLLYLRLEDIHPQYDPEILWRMARYLKSKEIPYMVAVIPVYINPQTHAEVHLADSPKLIKVLQYMQENGATIILHGYRHQYKDQETGEGFEYWDVENDRPILQAQHEKALLRGDFDSEQSYLDYMKERESFEEEYITNTLEKGVQELVTHKLYPLAFEAPHYAMSEKGYEILGRHFTTYVGQAQLSNLTWEGLYAPVYESKPKFLHGMRLLPETIGYLSPEESDPLLQIKKRITIASQFTNSFISGFYHPYLGEEQLKELIALMDSVPHSKWIDVKALDNHVQIAGISIRSTNGEIQVEKDFIASDYEREYLIKKLGPWLTLIILAILVSCYYFIQRSAKNQKQQDII